MSRISRTFRLASAAAVLVAMIATSADAHAIWFAQRAKRNALIYGIGADDLDMVKRLNLVTSVKGYDSHMKPVAATLRADGAIAVVDSDSEPALLTATMFNKVWSKPKDGGEWVEGGRDVVPDAQISEKNYKFTVYAPRPLSGPIPALPDQLLQIVPVGRIPEKMGAPLKLRVLLKGKPLAGAKLLTDFVNDPDAKPLVTGADGTVTIKVRNQGLNVINAVTTVASDEPKRIDRLEYEATFAFVLPHRPE
ncbi:MAG: nickel transporter substrate-binding protein [Phenylobacterium sp.]|nr:nickel transporter substrate-binding protein [Phenylobacterium sp.]